MSDFLAPLHVLPVNDLIEHVETGDDCPCGPQVELVQSMGVPDQYIIFHNSIDGRELAERGDTIPEETP